MNKNPLQPTTRGPFVLGFLASLALMAIGMGTIGTHAAASALIRANSYEKFEKYQGMYETWRLTSFAAVPVCLLFILATVLVIRRNRRATAGQLR